MSFTPALYSDPTHQKFNLQVILLPLLLALCMIIAACSSITLPADGHGTATITPSDRLIAGSRETIIITFTVGAGGIPVGGGVMLGLHHMSKFQDLQIDHADKTGYMTVEGETTNNFALEWHPGYVPREVIPAREDYLFNHCLIATVTKSALLPGEQVRFVLGANGNGVTVQRTTEQTAEFHIMTDGDADGVYMGIEHQPIVAIVANVAHHLVATVPATIIKNVPFEMRLRAEDEFFNLATNYNGKVTVYGPKGQPIAHNIPLSQGTARLEVSVTDSGPQRFRLDDGSLTGRSNPARSFDKPPEYSIFWGDLHGHSSLSDGLGDTADDYYLFARDIAYLDVCALTDHGVAHWDEQIAAVQEFYDPGNFVTLLAFEGGGKDGHMLLFFRADDEEPISVRPFSYEVDVKHMIEQYGTDGRLITGPAHFTGLGNSKTYPFGSFDERIMRFVELYSMKGASEYPMNPRPLARGQGEKEDFVQSAYAKGLQFGVIGTSDNHDSHPGRNVATGYPGGLAAFYAKELTREAIWDAFWNYRVYATSFDRIYVEFTVNGHIMGSNLETTAQSLIEYYVIGAEDDLEVFLIRNNTVIRKDSSSTGHLQVSYKDNTPVGNNFYYIRVVQNNGERAWSTPVWVERR